MSQLSADCLWRWGTMQTSRGDTWQENMGVLERKSSEVGDRNRGLGARGKTEGERQRGDSHTVTNGCKATKLSRGRAFLSFCCLHEGDLEMACNAKDGQTYRMRWTRTLHKVQLCIKGRECQKAQQRSWGDGSVSQALALEARGPECKPQHPYKNKSGRGDTHLQS